MNPWTFLEFTGWLVAGWDSGPYYEIIMDNGLGACPEHEKTQASSDGHAVGKFMCRVWKHTWPQALRDFNLTLAVIGKACGVGNTDPAHFWELRDDVNRDSEVYAFWNGVNQGEHTTIAIIEYYNKLLIDGIKRSSKLSGELRDGTAKGKALAKED